MANLFTGQAPAISDNIDGAPTTLGVTLQFAVAGVVSAVRFFSTMTVGGSYSAAVYPVTGSDPGYNTPLSTGTLAGPPTPATWTLITLASPVPVAAGGLLRAAMHNTQGRYVATSGLHSTDLTNGPITAPAHGSTVNGYSIFQAVYRSGGVLEFPASPAGSAGSYFVDVEFTPDGEAPGAELAGIPVAVVAGQPATRILAAAPAGLVIVTAAGAPTVSLNRSVAPSGVSVAAAPGAPAVARSGAGPAGLNVPAPVGPPAVNVGLLVVPAGVAVAVAVGTPTAGQPQSRWVEPLDLGVVPVLDLGVVPRP